MPKVTVLVEIEAREIAELCAETCPYAGEGDDEVPCLLLRDEYGFGVTREATGTGEFFRTRGCLLAERALRLLAK